MTATPRDATSVILLRDGTDGDGLETLMVRRHARSDFAADMHVFPGGAVEDSDCAEEVAGLCAGLGPGEAASLLADASSTQRALGIMVAGIRETFEEAGILLARDASGEVISCRGEPAAHLAALREEMKKGKLSFTEMVAGERLKLAVDLLVYFAHWITPELSPIRYDTRFFIAPAPPCQDALHDSVEVTDHVWIAPGEALRRNGEGTFAMLPPTIANLAALKPFANVEEALASLVGKEVAVVAPKVAFEGGKMRLLLPDGPDQG